MQGTLFISDHGSNLTPDVTCERLREVAAPTIEEFEVCGTIVEALPDLGSHFLGEFKE
jgi:hypothetical protein